MSELRPHFKDYNEWEKIDNEEIDRLQRNLLPHLRKIGIKMSKYERIQFVKEKLNKQNNTCIWGNEQNGRYCWNEPKYNWEKNKNGKKIEKICHTLKLQWGHLVPRCRNESFDISTICLMCGRCNNHIQTSRKPYQLLPELITKFNEITKLNKNEISNEIKYCIKKIVDWSNTLSENHP